MQSKRETTQAIIDGLLKFLATGGFLTTALILPNSAQIFDKPLDELIKTLDKRAQNRELNRIIRYMKHQGLVHYRAKDYENGMVLTKAGRQRLQQRNYETLHIPHPHAWDRKWRLVFFDIPEEQRMHRVSLTQKLRLLGFQQLQQSIWIHPFPCRPEVEAITETIGVRKFVTYVEIFEIDNNKALRQRFSKILTKQR